ncbi:PorV/PorQ family protein [Chloroherpeton thalassium]|uniref:PorV/PorQ family protein n=1 Tax=Chloroherpeton thalassium TaxID=100716 RepID=UPI00145D1062|nr:PorV/PorQ family protein [Chloroherpeton thalassium]
MTNAQAVLGKYAGEFLTLGAGGRYLGMGGAAVALSQDVTAGYWNPSGLFYIDYPQVAFMHVESFGSVVNYDYASVAFPFMSNKSLGISVIRVAVSSIPDTRAAWDSEAEALRTNADELITYFDAADYAFIFSYAAKSSYQMAYGISAKILHRNIGSIATAWGVGFDIGCQYTFSNGVQLGASVQDVTTTFLAWDTGENELIAPTLKLGSAYAFGFLFGKISLAMDSDVRFEGRKKSATFSLGQASFDFHAGVEYAYRDVVALRGGVDDIGRPTLGAGLKISKLNIDYGLALYNQTDEPGNTHRISLQIELHQENFKRN